MGGGTFAVLPAYEADLYGPKYVGAIHGRFLLAATVSTIMGPGLLLNLRKMAETDALTDLLSKVDPVAFASKFGADISTAPPPPPVPFLAFFLLTRPGRPPPKGDLRLKSMCFWLSKRTMNDGTFTTCLRTRMCLCLMRTRA